MRQCWGLCLIATSDYISQYHKCGFPGHHTHIFLILQMTELNKWADTDAAKKMPKQNTINVQYMLLPFLQYGFYHTTKYSLSLSCFWAHLTNVSKHIAERDKKHRDTAANPFSSTFALTFTLSVLTGSLSKDTVKGKMTSSFRTTGSSTGDWTRSQVGETHNKKGKRHVVTTHYITPYSQITCSLSITTEKAVQI